MTSDEKLKCIKNILFDTLPTKYPLGHDYKLKLLTVIKNHEKDKAHIGICDTDEYVDDCNLVADILYAARQYFRITGEIK